MASRAEKREKDWEHRRNSQKNLQDLFLGKMKQNKEKNEQLKKEEVAVTSNTEPKQIREVKRKIEKLEKELKREKEQRNIYQNQYQMEKEKFKVSQQELFEKNAILEEFIIKNQDLEKRKETLEKRILFLKDQLEKKEQSIDTLQGNNRRLQSDNNLMKQEHTKVMKDNKELRRIIEHKRLEKKFSEAQEMISMIEDNMSHLMNSLDEIVKDLTITDIDETRISLPQVLKGIKILIIGSRNKKINKYIERLESLGAEATSYDAYSKSLHLLAEKFRSADIVLACKQHIPHDVENVVDTHHPKYKLVHNDNLSIIVETSISKAKELDLLDK